MNREQIKKIGLEAGISEFAFGLATEEAWQQVERFVSFVAAAEREACEKVASDYADYQRSFGDEYAELRAMGALEVIDRIRARGQE